MADNYAIEVRSDVSGMPHSYVVLYKNGQPVGSYGFYPKNDGSPISPGILKDDTGHEYNISTGPIPITEQGFQNVSEYIRQTQQNPPQYNIFQGSQCANWAYNALEQAGIEGFVSSNMEKENFFTDLGQTLIWNPYTQALNMWIQGKVEPYDPDVEVQILPADPIVINIDGKGIGVASYKGESIAMFDFDGDGVVNYTSWVAEGSGLLVLDKNADGKINSGNELFGDDTVLSNNATAVNGYEALAELDSNGDGKIDAQDKEFKNLKVWQDADGDGVTDEGELRTLEELEIASLDLNYKDVNKNLGNGNSITQISSYTKTDGTTGEMGDVNLSYNDSITQYRDPIQLTAEQSARPNFLGHGNLRDLNQAAATSNELAGILDQYSAASTKAGQIALLDNLIMAWAKTSPYYNAAHSVSIAAAKYIEVASSDTKMTRAQFNALQQKAVAFAETLHISQDSLDKVKAISGKFCVLGELLGKQTSTLYLGNAEELDNIINNIENTYKDFSKAFYTSLAMQTRLQDYFEKAVFVQGGDGQYHWDFIGAQEAFNKVWTTDQAKAFVDLGEFIQIFNWDGGKVLFNEWLAIAQEQGVADEYLALLGEGGFLLDYQKLDGAGTLKGSAKNDILQGSDADDRLEAGDGDDVINAADGNDRIYGGNGSDTITGGRGNDAIYDGNGDDRVDAGDGNDYIEGGQGSDTYIFKGNFGKDAGGNYCRSCAGDTASFCPGTARRRMWRCSINFDEAPRMGRFLWRERCGSGETSQWRRRMRRGRDESRPYGFRSPS